MQTYRNIDGDSGIVSYEYGSDWIIVKFKNGRTYKYTYSSAGTTNIKRMKILADQSNGLNSFISRVVKKRYLRRIS
jgi:hypothetical protein